MATAELRAAYQALSEGITDFPNNPVNVGAMLGASDINAGWTLLSGYLVSRGGGAEPWWGCIRGSHVIAFEALAPLGLRILKGSCSFSLCSHGRAFPWPPACSAQAQGPIPPSGWGLASHARRTAPAWSESVLSLDLAAP